MIIRLTLMFLGLLLSLTSTISLAAASVNKVTILTYHEIADKSEALEPDYTVTPSNFLHQLEWLKSNGYHFVSMDDVLADRAGKTPLPDKAVMLTFDDGYRSVYTHAFPILKMFKAPAVIALIGSWLESPGDKVHFEDRDVPRTDMLLWSDVREMEKSGLVEVANHTFAMHEGIPANPQGNLEPAVTTRRYLPAQTQYEDEAHYHQRLMADIKHNSELLYKRTGKAPRIMIWPYGRYNSTSMKIAHQLGMPIGMTLDDGANRIDTPLGSLRRVLVEDSMSLNDFVQELKLRNVDASDNDRSTKIMHVDLDDIYDPDPAQQDRNLGSLLDRIVTTGVTTVYLKAFSDPDHNGTATAAYFPNRHLPMRADLFNRAAWQIRTRTQVKRLYAWMPLLAFELPKRASVSGDKTLTQTNKVDHVAMSQPRLSPFSPRARQTIREIYQDLARYSTFEGLLFGGDDATQLAHEDASTWALRANKKRGLSSSLANIRHNDDLSARWSRLQINQLDNFAKELTHAVRQEQPDLKTAHNLNVSEVLNPHSEAWFTQSLKNSLATYDFTAIMATPKPENGTDPIVLLHEVVDKVKEQPGAMNKVVFELPSSTWQNDQSSPDKKLTDTLNALYSWGAHHISGYPGIVHNGNPGQAEPKPVLDSQAGVEHLNNPSTKSMVAGVQPSSTGR